MSSAAAAAAEMDAHKEEIRGTMTLTQHILLTQREHPVRPVVFCVETNICRFSSLSNRKPRAS